MVAYEICQNNFDKYSLRVFNAHTGENKTLITKGNFDTVYNKMVEWLKSQNEEDIQ